MGHCWSRQQLKWWQQDTFKEQDRRPPIHKGITSSSARHWPHCFQRLIGKQTAESKGLWTLLELEINILQKDTHNFDSLSDLHSVCNIISREYLTAKPHSKISFDPEANLEEDTPFIVPSAACARQFYASASALLPTVLGTEPRTLLVIC